MVTSQPFPTKPGKPKITLDWSPMQGITGFTLGPLGSVWKGQKGWWASRKGVDGQQGPFGGYRQAQAWVEEPLVRAKREQADRRAEKAGQSALKQAAAREAQDLKTWGGLPPGERVLRPGQVWVHKARPGREAMILEVRKDTLVGLFRSDPDLAWKDATRDTKDLQAFLRQYGCAGVAPGAGKKV